MVKCNVMRHMLRVVPSMFVVVAHTICGVNIPSDNIASYAFVLILALGIREYPRAGYGTSDIPLAQTCDIRRRKCPKPGKTSLQGHKEYEYLKR
jgi:hypothetical protein